jgi:L-asparaginase
MIKVFTTGGTIDKVYFDARSEYEVGEPQIVEILREANVTTVVHIEKLFQKDSLEMTDEDREEIRRRILADPAERLLITHGTDTMVETAQALRGIDGKTIVLVGSLSPAMFKSSDAEFNVGFALGALLALPHGVYIAMNGHIFEPGKVTKNRAANRFEALAPE